LRRRWIVRLHKILHTLPIESPIQSNMPPANQKATHLFHD